MKAGWYIVAGVGLAVAGGLIYAYANAAQSHPMPAERIVTSTSEQLPGYTAPQLITNNSNPNPATEGPATSMPTSTQVPTAPSNVGAGFISSNANSITMTDGATVTISGSGFRPNSNGNLATKGGANIGLGMWTADSVGNWSITITYTFNSTNASPLANAIMDVALKQNWIGVVAYSYTTSSYSNTLYLYF